VSGEKSAKEKRAEIDEEEEEKKNFKNLQKKLFLT